MKSIVFKMWLAIAMLWVSVSSFAYDFEIDGIYYDVTSFTELTVTASSLSESVEGSVTIPSTVAFSGKELKVTAIGEDFAEGNKEITSVIISEGISNIGARAFCGCSNLAEVIIPESVLLISNSAFQDCTNLKSISCVGTVELGAKAFFGCTSLVIAALPKLTTLPDSAFEACSKLSICNIASATSIGVSAFNGCTFSSFDIPASVNTIGKLAFANCTKLKSFIIPDNVTEVGTDLFAGCTSLKEVSIGAGLRSLPWLFTGCINLEKLCIEDSNETLTFEYCGERRFKDETGGIKYTSRCYYTPVEPMFANTNLREVYIGRNITTEAYKYKKTENGDCIEDYYYMPNSPFSGSNITKVEIGALVNNFGPFPPKDYSTKTYVRGTFLGDFENCRHLIYVDLQSTGTTIRNNVFAGCTSLKDIKIPNSVERLGESIFQGCSSLESITLGCNLRTIGDNAFSDCSSLSTINLCAPIPPSYLTGFTSQEYIYANVNIPTGSLSSYQNVEPWCNFWNLKEDDGLISTFWVDNIQYSVTSDQNVKIIGNNLPPSDELCINAKVSYYDVEYAVIAIADGAFKYCSALQKLEISNGIISIGDEAFGQCNNLTEVYCPPSLKSLGNGAFMNCTKLKVFNFYNALSAIPEKCFFGCDSLSAFYLEGVREIGDYCFANSGLTKISIPSSLRMIGQSAFNGCNNLNELIIEDSQRQVLFPNGSFDVATDIKETVVDGKTVRFKIEFYDAFFYKLPIEKLYIGQSLSDSPHCFITGNGGVEPYILTYYDLPFSNLPNLRQLTIGEFVNTLGPDVQYFSEVGLYAYPSTFIKSEKLERVTVLNTTPPSGVQFSDEAYSKAVLVVPDDTSSLYRVADGWKEFVHIMEASESGIDDAAITSNQSCLSLAYDGVCYEGDTVEQVSIYAIDGKLIYSSLVEPQQIITLPKGYYVVMVKGQTIKIMI